jgi:hypothetical protein
VADTLYCCGWRYVFNYIFSIDIVGGCVDCDLFYMEKRQTGSIDCS